MAERKKPRINLEIIKELRRKSGVGVGDCKEALEESDGDFDKAIDILRKKGVLKAKKRASREASNGFIGSYVHQGQIGVLVELVCETDFVARNERFQKLAHEIALHIAASSPIYVSAEEVPEKVKEKEVEIIKDRLKEEGKPEEILEKIAEGQLAKFYEETCLLDQPYVRDEKKKIKDLIAEAVAAFGEKIEVRRFVRLVLGEEEE
jgi:elongation factor Ts